MERPSYSDPRIKERVISKLVKDCVRWNADYDEDDWRGHLERVNLNQNGFEIAKDLERNARVYGIDAELVEILDYANSYRWDERDALVREWVAETGVKPTLAIGTPIKSRHNEGTIQGIHEDMGAYLLVPYGEEDRFARGGGVIVPYEEAEPQERVRDGKSGPQEI